MKNFALGFVACLALSAGVALAYDTATADTYMKAISNLAGISAVDCTITGTDGGAHERRAEAGAMQPAYAKDRAP